MTGFRKSLRLLTMVALLVGGIIWYYAWARDFAFRLNSPEMMILISPNRNERVFLFGEGFTDHTISLCVPSNNDTRVKRIGALDFQDFDAVWSGDGSVLAFEVDDNYIFAYDLKSARAIPTDTGAWIDKSYHIKPEDLEKITALIRERGAPKYRIPCSMFRTFVPMKYPEWKKLRAALWAGDHPGERNPWRT